MVVSPMRTISPVWMIVVWIIPIGVVSIPRVLPMIVPRIIPTGVPSETYIPSGIPPIPTESPIKIVIIIPDIESRRFPSDGPA